MVETVRVKGLRELEKALAELPSKAVAKGVLRRVLKKAGQPLADKARSLVPVNTGTLRDSIAVSTKAPKGADSARAAFANVMKGGGSRGDAVAAMVAARKENQGLTSAYVGPGRHPQAIFQEFGTKAHAPQSFMRPAWDSTKGEVLDVIKTDLGDEIMKAAQRAAKKALKAR